MAATLLFNDRRMFEYQQGRNAHAKGLVDRVPDRQVLDDDRGELLKALYEDAKIDSIRLDFDGIYQDEPREVDIRYQDPYARETGTYRGTRVVVHLPFRGDSELLRIQPSTHNLSPPRAEVKGQEILITWEGRAQEAGLAKGRIDEVLGHLRTWVNWSNQNTEEFNSDLQRQLAAMFDARRQHLEKNREIAETLNIPVGRRPNPAPDFVAIPRRRPVVIETPRVKPPAHEARISDEDYAAIIDQLTSARGLIERLPATFAPMSEETLRDILLVILNNQFGVGSAEMFSRGGKTDILIQQERGPVFIAECKIWSGAAAFRAAIAQLLGYLVWRDTKAALILFVHEKGVSGIVDKAAAELRGHDQFVREGPAIGDSPTFIVHHEGDEKRQIRLALLIIAVPDPKQTA